MHRNRDYTKEEMLAFVCEERLKSNFYPAYRQGVFKQCSCVMKKGIEEYLAWAMKHRRNPKAENELRYVKEKFGDCNLSNITMKDVA